ncbi:hypothetical protein [Isoptericola croceus]|uniref:hypothetical protein n=1 Tax=Isoptericola croceus TaxID=3031406 RepID=UPI0023F6BA3B|nr:hypothetical protein [Isoptericola croceus]
MPHDPDVADLFRRDERKAARLARSHRKGPRYSFDVAAPSFEATSTPGAHVPATMPSTPSSAPTPSARPTALRPAGHALATSTDRQAPAWVAPLALSLVSVGAVAATTSTRTNSTYGALAAVVGALVLIAVWMRWRRISHLTAVALGAVATVVVVTWWAPGVVPLAAAAIAAAWARSDRTTSDPQNL